MKLLEAILALATIFTFVGIIYPTPLHHKVKLDKRWKSLLACFVISVIGGALFGGSDKTSTAPTASDNTVKATSTTTEAKPAAPAPKPAPAPAPKAKQWTKVIEFSGDQTNSPTDRFQLTGGDVKMEWEIKPDSELAKDAMFMGGFLEDANNNPVDQFMGNPGQTKGEWKVYGVPAGTYYFKPNAANGKYHAVIYELK